MPFASFHVRIWVPIDVRPPKSPTEVRKQREFAFVPGIWTGAPPLTYTQRCSGVRFTAGEMHSVVTSIGTVVDA